MPSRVKLLLLLGSMIFAIGLIAHFQLRDPTFDGKNLGDWVWTLRHASSPAHEQEARTAIQALCTNNIPELVNALNYDSATELNKIRSRIRWLPKVAQDVVMNSRLVNRRGINSAVAGAALSALGPAAAPAVPGLKKLLYGTNLMISLEAGMSLAGLGTNGVPTLIDSAADPACASRSVAIACIGLTKLGTNVAPAIPVIRCSQDKNQQVANDAARTLQLLATQPGIEIPASVLTPPAPVRSAGIPVPGLPNE
jgi:hypothetical protein